MSIRRFIALMAISATLMVAVIPVGAKEQKDDKDNKKESVADTVKKVSEYQKIFKDKKVVTAKGFMTIHMVDNKDIIVELPKDILGRDVLLSAGVDMSSNGGDGTVGYAAPKTIHAQFSMVDSLIVLKEVNSYQYLSSGEESENALKLSNNGSVIEKFEIKAMSPDSSAFVFDATGFFASHDRRLDPVDPLGVSSFGGALTTKLSHKSNLSMPAGVEGFLENVAVLRYETYSVEKDFGGWKLVNVDESENLMTILVRKSILLLPQETARLRFADTRIGVNAISKVVFHNDDRGSRSNWYVNRWDISKGDKIIFYIDTLFTDKMADRISAGILKWNDAFEEMGFGKVLETKPYPSSCTDFNANDLRYSCVRCEVLPSDVIRSNTWTDPRSGEIFCASITVPVNILQKLHTSLLMEIGAADPQLRSINHEAESIYDALQAQITNKIGLCLGLTPNLVASSVFPADSLSSPTFTSRYGLSASVMDRLPANYFAKEGDKERGVCLIHKELGAYDKYAINWLYCNIQGAVSPEDEVAYLDSLIAASRENPHCYYVRRPPHRFDPRFYMDPRPVADDLSDDPIKSINARTASLRHSLSNLKEWIGKEDPDFAFRLSLNESIILGSAYPVLDMMKYIGGIYVNEKKEGDQILSYEFVPKEKQREILMFLVDHVASMGWLDETDAWRDVIFVRSFADYVQGMLITEFDSIFRKLAFAETKMDTPYTVSEAFSDMLDLVMADVKAGKPSARNELMFQIFMINEALTRSNINPRISKSIQLKYEDRKSDVFSPMPSVDFQSYMVNDYRIYKKLEEIRDLYKKAASKEKNADMKIQYEYFAMAIDLALKID